MTERNRNKPAGQPPASTDDGFGHLGADDRGNVTWEWQDEGDLLADDEVGAAERMSALVDPDLQVKEEAADSNRPGQVSERGLKSGYNPYNSGALGKQKWKKKKNLKELSKWIELRKRMAGEKNETDEKTEDEE